MSTLLDVSRRTYDVGEEEDDGVVLQVVDELFLPPLVRAGPIVGLLDDARGIHLRAPTHRTHTHTHTHTRIAHTQRLERDVRNDWWMGEKCALEVTLMPWA